MSVRLRLSREGRKNRAFFRIVAIDAKTRRDGPFIERIGYYDPLKKDRNWELKAERVEYWLSHGAIPSETVKKLIQKSGIAIPVHKSRRRKKAQRKRARAKAASQAPAEA